MNTFCEYAFYFFLYSFFGWVAETIYCSIGEKQFVNRGFLTGPMCPIYGTGATVFNVFLMPFYEKYGTSKWYIIILVILLGMVLADIVEFFTSLIMEKLFNARWWDYSNEKFNIQGRICLKHTCYWGIASGLYVYVVHANLKKWIDSLLTSEQITKIFIIIMIVFVIDLIFAFKAAFDVRKFMTTLNKLHSELIKIQENSGKKINELTVDIRKQLEDVEDALKSKIKITKSNKTYTRRVIRTRKTIMRDIKEKAEFIKSSLKDFLNDEDYK